MICAGASSDKRQPPFSQKFLPLPATEARWRSASPRWWSGFWRASVAGNGRNFCENGGWRFFGGGAPPGIEHGGGGPPPAGGGHASGRAAGGGRGEELGGGGAF